MLDENKAKPMKIAIDRPEIKRIKSAHISDI